LEQIELLRYALGALDALGIQYMLVGSIASMAYGEPRMTRDIDIVVRLAAEQVDALCDAFPAPAFYVSRDAASDAVRRRSQFNIIHPASGNKLDLMVSQDDAWAHSEFARRRTVTLLPGLAAPLAAPEDLILAKMAYYREGEHEKHLRDIASMLRISGEQIDRDYIRDWSDRLGLLDIWQVIAGRLGESCD
jgi:hypothetical protein